MTTISVSTPIDLRGLQLELAGQGVGPPQKLLSDQLDMVFGREEGKIRIGILDLDGANVIPSGENRVIEVPGRFDVITARVSDGEYRSLVASLASGAASGDVPDEFRLSQNWPNPFNPSTEIRFTLPTGCHARIDVFNVMGQKVATVVDDDFSAGEHVCFWDGTEHSSGVYFYRLTTPQFVQTRKMMLLK